MREDQKEVLQRNIDRLHDYIGELITYKAITELLEIKYYNGSSKVAQLKQIEQYYKLEKVNTKYLIVEKYDDPILLVDNRQSIYYDDLETIILYALQNTENYHNIWSVTESLIVTSLVNNNYRIGKKDVSLTADALEIDIDYLNNFYQSTHSRFKGIFESSLKRMQNKKLINYKEITMLYKRILSIKLNDLGIPIIDESGKIQYSTYKAHVEATAEERQIILKVESQVLHSMGYDRVSDLIKEGKYNKYKYEVNQILKEKLNIEYYYLAYDIVHNKEDIQEAISYLKKIFAEDSLNNIKLEALNNSKDKLLNKDILNKELCIDILINKYPLADLRKIIKAHLKDVKEREIESDPL